MPAFSPRVFDQFKELIDKLQAHAGVMANARHCQAQPKWLELSEKVSTRLELLELMDRVELNEEFKQMAEKSTEVEVLTSIVAELQHDFLAAVARDFFVVRSPRLGRMYRQIAMDAGVSPLAESYVVTTTFSSSRSL